MTGANMPRSLLRGALFDLSFGISGSGGVVIIRGGKRAGPLLERGLERKNIYPGGRAPGTHCSRCELSSARTSPWNPGRSDSLPPSRHCRFPSWHTIAFLIHRRCRMRWTAT